MDSRVRAMIRWTENHLRLAGLGWAGLGRRVNLEY